MCTVQPGNTVSPHYTKHDASEETDRAEVNNRKLQNLEMESGPGNPGIRKRRDYFREQSPHLSENV